MQYNPSDATDSRGRGDARRPLQGVRVRRRSPRARGVVSGAAGLAPGPGASPPDAAAAARSSAWPELPSGHACPSTAASLPGRGNFLSIRKFSPVRALEGCSARWNDELHRHFFRGSPPSRRGIECLGTTFGVNHVIDLRRPDEILMDSRSGGFRSEEEALADFSQRHPEHPMRYFNVRTTRESPRREPAADRERRALRAGRRCATIRPRSSTSTAARAATGPG
jgi:hypothetical protein